LANETPFSSSHRWPQLLPGMADEVKTIMKGLLAQQ
jgi:hypothetical protein